MFFRFTYDKDRTIKTTYGNAHVCKLATLSRKHASTAIRFLGT